MYVCLCAAVTESQIQDAIRGGATTMKQLRARLDVANCCGACEPVVRDCLKQALARPGEPKLKLVGT